MAGHTPPNVPPSRNKGLIGRFAPPCAENVPEQTFSCKLKRCGPARQLPRRVDLYRCQAWPFTVAESCHKWAISATCKQWEAEAQERLIAHGFHDLQQAPLRRTVKFVRNCAPTVHAANFNEAGRFMWKCKLLTSLRCIVCSDNGNLWDGTFAACVLTMTRQWATTLAVPGPRQPAWCGWLLTSLGEPSCQVLLLPLTPTEMMMS